MIKSHIDDDEARAMNPHWNGLMEQRARDLLNRLNLPVTGQNLDVVRPDIEVIDINARRDAYYYVITSRR